MGDLISRSALIERIDRYGDVYAMEVIMEAPAVDAVEVVRCRDCERRAKSADLTDTVYCKWLSLQMPKDGFCSYGERRRTEENDGK